MEEVPREHVPDIEPPETVGIFDEPEIFPRIGDEYQASIPSLEMHLADNEQADSKNCVDCGDYVSDERLELPIYLVWINQDSEKSKPEKKDTRCNTELREPYSSSRKHGAGRNRGNGECLVPGIEVEAWSEIEEAGFLLSLYIFGKNFARVEKFVGSKRMGDILTFYYGKFYNSKIYRRWAECRKSKSRKCIFGHKIFTGSRQQEVVSRLMASADEDLRGALLEVSKTYAVGDISVEEYVFNLKALVEMESLVKAVAIGKGKNDLTGLSVDTSKASRFLPTRLDVPVGKDWSSLPTTSIVQFLTGNFRLSKGKSIDLFWEAVWPRLLARGWHSEQPKGYAFVSGSKQSLVYLMPGVKKFSRRKLVKGEDYFDSISDILNKVAKDPMLLEAKTDHDSDHKLLDAADLGDDIEHADFGDQQMTYLKPRAAKPDVEFVELTVIDTTLAATGTGKKRKVTCWPVQSLNIPTSRSSFKEIENNVVEGPRDSGDTSCFELKAKKSKAWNAGHTVSGGHTNGQASTSLRKQVTTEMTNSAVTETQLEKKSIKLKRSINQVSIVHKIKAVAVKKPNKLTAGSHQVRGQSKTTLYLHHFPSQREDKLRSYNNINASGSGISQISVSQEKLAPEISSASQSSKTDAESMLCNSCGYKDNEVRHEKPHPRVMIDLNLPYISDNEMDGLPEIEVLEKEDDRTEIPDIVNASKVTLDLSSPEEEQATNSRRHSTRNRPLTAKVLNAIADGFLEVTPRRKRRESSSSYLSAKPSQSPDGNFETQPRRKRMESSPSDLNSTPTQRTRITPNGIMT